MSRSFDIIMAGTISGIVAISTSFLGVGGTVIGAVLGAILYQILSIFIKEPLENATIRKVENEIVFIIPLVLIAIFIAVFIVAYLHTYLMHFPDFYEFFKQLEEITNDSLLRILGIGLMIMGIYPLLRPEAIKREYGAVILVLGVILLVRGLLDVDPNFLYLYVNTLGVLDLVLIILIFLTLVFIIIKIFLESVTLYRGRDKNIITDSSNKKYVKITDRDILKSEDKNSFNKNKTSNTGNRTIKSDKTTTMSKNEDYFKR